MVSQQKRFFFGIDVGGTFVKLALMQGQGRLVGKVKFPSHGFHNKSVFVRELKQQCDRLLQEFGQKQSAVLAMGIGLPGPVDTERGVVLSLTNISGWKNFPLVNYLREFFSCPVFIDNDANCMALAESRLGAATGARVALCLTLGTGVGGGIIWDGQIYRGPFYLGGEIGHVPVTHKGSRCRCGGRGCLEQYVGNKAIARRIREIFGSPLSLEDVSQLAKKSDPRARQLWQEVGTMIGVAIAGIVNVLTPQVVVVGGGVANAGGVLLQAIRQSVRVHLMRQLKKRVQVRAAQMGNDAGVLGAALLASEGLGRIS